MENVKKGTRFIVVKDFSTHAMTSWGKPYTGSEDCIIPKGTVMVAEHDQIEGALGFGVVPEKYKELEPEFIPKKTLNDKDYGGYYFSFEKEDYGRYFIYLDENKNDPSQYAIGEKIPAKNTLVLKDSKTLKMVKNPNPNDIEKAVMSFIAKNTSENFVPGYIMITPASIVPNITVLSKENGFCVECQEGSERHKSKRNFNAEEIINILISFVNGTDEWKKSVEVK
ncbi:MAG: hypothetical protein HQL12_00860 [Candidatus Omnitrophica bacterium]|nr:hypothetical protein [Candidatus Omnitrophota bacterium]